MAAKIMKPQERGRCEGCWFFEPSNNGKLGTVFRCRYYDRGQPSRERLFRDCRVTEISVMELDAEK